MLVPLTRGVAKAAAHPSKTSRYTRSEAFDDAFAVHWKAVSPMFAHVYVENGCHLKCDHCYEAVDTHPPKTHLSLEQYADIFDGLKKLGVLVITFSGGEPFLRKDFLDIVELARKKRFAVRIYTSGTPITAIKADRMRDLKVAEVHVSLYSADPDVHDGFTGMRGSHKKSVRALDLCAARGIKTVVKTTVTTFNVDALDDIITLAKRTGSDYMFDGSIKPRWNGDTKPLQYKVSPEVLKEKVFSRPDLDSGMTKQMAEHYCTGENHRAQGGGLCTAGRNFIAVWADGQIAPCAFFPKAGGSALTDGVEKVWRESRLFHDVRKKQFKEMTSCGSCEVSATCSPCMAYGLVEHDDIGGCASSSKHSATARMLLAEEIRSGVRAPTLAATVPLADGAPSTNAAPSADAASATDRSL